MKSIELASRGPGQTRQLGEKIGRLAQAGDVILLSGELGAGKTCLTQGIARGLGIRENALSPTFVIMRGLSPPPMPRVAGNASRSPWC